MPDYKNDFLAFRRDLCPVEGDYGPQPIIPPWLAEWYRLAFPGGVPAARNIMDLRTKKEGKSSDAAAVACYLATRREYSEVVVVASTKDQAKDRVLRAAKFACQKGPLVRHAKIYRDVIEFDNHSTVMAIPSDWAGASGGNYSGIIFDELHTYTLEAQRRLFDELIIPPSITDGCRWIASYAGFLGESELLYEWWMAGLDGERVSELPIYARAEMSLLAFIDVGEASWRMPWITKKFIAQTEASERANPFARLWLNEWRTNVDQFITPEQWEACRGEVRPFRIGDGRKLVLGADASTSRDHTSLVGTCRLPDGKVEVPYIKTWEPVKGELRGGKPTVDLEETIGEAVRELHAAKQIERIVADPYQLHTLMIQWEKAGIIVEEMPQTNARIESDQALYDDIISKTIVHYGDPTLTKHMENSVARETPRGFRLDKSKTSRKIDAAVALSMANHKTLLVQAEFKCLRLGPPYDGNTRGEWGKKQPKIEKPMYGNPGRV